MTFSPKNHAPSALAPIPRTGISGAPGILLHILLCLTAAAIPTGMAVVAGTSRLLPAVAEVLSVVLLLLVGVYFFRTGKLSGKKTRGMLPLLVLMAVTLVFATQSAIPAAIAFSLIFFMGEGAVLLATQPSKTLVYFPLVPLAAFGLALLTCRGIDTSLLCLTPLPAAIALAWGTRSSAAKDTGLTRVGVICLTSLCLGITVAGFGAWFLYQALGSLSVPTLQAFVEELRQALVTAVMSVQLETTEGTVYVFEGKEQLVSNAVNVTINILPGAAVALTNVVAATAQMITLSGLVAFGFGESVTDRVREYRISAVSSFVFLVALITSLIANANTISMVGTVAENFSIILLPGVGLAGFLRLMQAMARKGCGIGCFVFILLVIPGVSAYGFFALAIYEAVASVFGPLLAKLKPPKHDDDDFFPPHQDHNDHDNNDNDDDDSDPSSNGGPSLF